VNKINSKFNVFTHSIKAHGSEQVMSHRHTHR